MRRINPIAPPLHPTRRFHPWQLLAAAGASLIRTRAEVDAASEELKEKAAARRQRLLARANGAALD